MIPVLKIRLYKLRRKIGSSIFQMGFPIIMVLIIFLCLLSFFKKLKPPEEIQYNPSSFTLINPEYPFPNFTSIALISKDQDISDSFMSYVKTKCLLCRIEHYETYENFEAFINSEKYIEQFMKLIEINNDDSSINFKMKDFNFTVNSIYNEVNELSFNSDMLMGASSDEGNNKIFEFYQKLFSNFLVYYKKLQVKANMKVTYQPITTPKIFSILTDPKLIALLPVYMSMSYSSVFFNIILWMVTEKEKKLNELLARQGISHTTYLISWFLIFLFMTLIPTIIATTILNYVFLYHSRIILLNIFQILFTINLFAMCFFFQSFIDKIQTGNTLIKVVYIGVLIFSFAVARPEVPTWVKLICSIFPQVTQVISLQIFVALDNFETGLDWKLFTSKYSSLSLLSSLICYLVSIFIFIGIGMFVTVFKNSGLSFVDFIKSWFVKKKNSIEDYEKLFPKTNNDVINNNIEFNHQELSQTNQNFKHQNKYLKISDITRLYGDLRAVDNFNGELFPNEIFCLLGHNGAGKTTLIKMISGIEDPDKGDIFLDNTSLVTNKDYLFKNIGLCMQDDIFFDYLTVKEHLTLMSEIKGKKANMNEILDLIQRIELTEKADAIASTLSGGQKRKLCIALALIGNSKLILLDEPTSGMDVIAKRALWEFLKGYKNDKIIILTTHSLDEAEYLGDRIGIMSEGKYICSGTSSYLKSKYPCGYNINLIIDSKVFSMDKRNNLFKKLKEIDPTAVIKISSKCVLSINFMNISEQINNIFKEIDSVKSEYGIEDYTVSTTTLEDVFLKLNSNELSEDMFNMDSKNTINDTDNKDVIIDTKTYDNNKYEPLINIEKQGTIFDQFTGNLRRHFISLWRNKKIFILEIIAASIVFILYSLVLKNLIDSINSYSYQDLNYLITQNPINYKFFDIDTKYFTDSSYLSTVLPNKVVFREMTSISIKKEDSTIDIDNAYKKDPYRNERTIISISKNNGDLVVNNLFQAASPEYYQATMNFILSSFFENEYGIKASFSNVYSKVPLGNLNTMSELVGQISLNITSILIVWCSYVSIGGYMLNTPLKERISNVKHLLFLSGSNMISYWLSLLIVDIFKYLVLTLIIFPFLIYLDTFFLYYLILLFFYFIAVNIFTYCFSYLFSQEESGQKYYLLIVFAISIVLPIVTIVREALGQGLQKFFYSTFFFTESDLLPTSSLFIGLARTYLITLLNPSVTSEGIMKVILNYIVIFIILIVFYGIILLLLEKRILGKLLNKFLVSQCFVDKKIQLSIPQIGSDSLPLSQFDSNAQLNQYTLKEKEKIINQGRTLTTIINDLQKTFFVCCGKHLRAVNRLYLGLEANEKFGLLGFNGSGKTTTFKAITNEIFFDRGTISLFGQDSQKEFNLIRRSIGYCPQENALFDYLSVSEVITFYKDLKNVNEPVDRICHRFGLEKYLNTQSINLSGGNKRKLAFAIALMNYPKLLLLDEPSTGVDPESRRVMWKNINMLSRNSNEYNMILSTHSMEEAEILCDTVSWLKAGNFVCIGNPEKLKLQFSAGYNLHVKFIQEENNNNNKSNDGLIFTGEISQPTENIVANLNSKLVSSNHIIEQALGSMPLIASLLGKFDIVLNTIRDKCQTIQLDEIRNDYSFELSVHVDPQQQGELFSTILNMKNLNKSISEISINIQSLENILTKQ